MRRRCALTTDGLGFKEIRAGNEVNEFGASIVEPSRTRVTMALVGLLVAAPLMLAYGAMRFVSPESSGAFGVVAISAVLGALLLVPLVSRRAASWPPRLSGWFVVRQLLWGLLFGLLWVTVVVLLSAMIARPGGDIAVNIMGWELFVGFWLYVAVGTIAFTERSAERSRALERTAAEAKLAALGSKLQPHFLFNVLNSIIELIDEAPETAETAVADLSALLRRAVRLEPDRHVPVAEELEFVERYLALERLRLGDRLETRVVSAASANDRSIPAFGVQTLVENAVRHGIAPAPAGGRIEVVAEVDGDTLRVVVRDTGRGCDPTRLASGEGRGLATLRGVLEARYGAAASLSTTAGVGVGCEAVLEISGAAP